MSAAFSFATRAALGYRHPPMKCLTGQLLLASRRLLDPNFHRTVILIVQHGKDGALGLVLNRPTDVTVKQACEEDLEVFCQADNLLYQGGPCRGPLMALHTHEDSVHFGADQRCQVLTSLYFSTDDDELEWLLRQEKPTAIFFSGYSGWGPGQLESELASGAWLVTPATSQRVFNAANSGQWSKLVTEASLGGRIKPELIPDDPSVN
jgi:putative transcriptional regulator